MQRLSSQVARTTMPRTQLEFYTFPSGHALPSSYLGRPWLCFSFFVRLKQPSFWVAIPRLCWGEVQLSSGQVHTGLYLGVVDLESHVFVFMWVAAMNCPGVNWVDIGCANLLKRMSYTGLCIAIWTHGQGRYSSPMVIEYAAICPRIGWVDGSGALDCARDATWSQLLASDRKSVV